MSMDRRVRRFIFSLKNSTVVHETPCKCEPVSEGRSKVSYVLDEKKPGLTTETVAVQPSKTKGPGKVETGKEADTSGNVSELTEALRLEKERSEGYLRRLQYLQADFENYRKRVETEMSDVRRLGNERLLSELLPVKDELELAYGRARESKENPLLLEGVAMILKRLQGLLSKEGVERIPGEGSKFNPAYHEAALRVLSEEEEGTVVEEVRPGYLLRGKVLRPSIVKVAEKHPEGEAETIASDKEGEVEKE